MKKKLSLPKQLIIIAYMFLSIFSPDFFKSEMTTLMFYAGVFYIILNIIYYNKIYISKKIILPLIIFLPFICYIVGISLLYMLSIPGQRGAYITNVTQHLSVMAKWYVTYLVFYIITVKYQFEVELYFHYLLVVGIIQTICVILALMFPNIRNTFNNFTITNGHSQHMISYVLMNSQRSYGLADNLFDSFGYTTSFIIIISFIFAVSKNQKYLFLFLVMLIMPLLNTRTGLLLVFLCCIYIILYYFSNILLKNIHKYVIGFIIISFSFSTLYNFIPADTRKWIDVGLNSIITLFSTGEETSGFAAMKKMIGIPDNWFLGEGSSPEMLSVGGTDIGYIQCIWRYGMIGTVLLLAGFLYIFFFCFRNSEKKYLKCFAVCVGIIFFVYLYKLYSIGNICGNFIIFSWFAVCVNDNNHQTELINKGVARCLN